MFTLKQQTQQYFCNLLDDDNTSNNYKLYRQAAYRNTMLFIIKCIALVSW